MFAKKGKRPFFILLENSELSLYPFDIGIIWLTSQSGLVLINRSVSSRRPASSLAARRSIGEPPRSTRV
jgi:hypothetical protein